MHIFMLKFCFCDWLLALTPLHRQLLRNQLRAIHLGLERDHLKRNVAGCLHVADVQERQGVVLDLGLELFLEVFIDRDFCSVLVLEFHRFGIRPDESNGLFVEFLQQSFVKRCQFLLMPIVCYDLCTVPLTIRLSDLYLCTVSIMIVWHAAM